ncbi:hypothetical protein AVEN_245341-1 [Araneus ventricosus]|uniref:CCHC-type domain-containing protein n=1 Tax=Araneus ventricosus TaxID=182803 RepID=A0A4Y2PET9_ARAVE|nr:hypothetical protein AVEN_245341-1 [Araneus ventricosus]
MGSRNLAPDGEMRPSTPPSLKEYPSSSRFFVIKRKEDNFKLVSAILIYKSILSIAGEMKSIKKCNNGNILVETATPNQASQIVKLEHIGEHEVIVAPHFTLNQSKGVVSEAELQNDTEEEILKLLENQNVREVRRINIRKNGQTIPTKHLVLTFNTPNLPESVRIAYLNCPVRAYIPNPLRCYKCQRFGHTTQSCRGKLTCAQCSQIGHESKTCNVTTPYCINCKENHPAYAKVCSSWKMEKEIQTTKIKQNISFREARKIIESRTPKVGVSYSSVMKTTSISMATQTAFSAEICQTCLLKQQQNLTCNKPIPSMVLPIDGVHTAINQLNSPENNQLVNSTDKTVLPNRSFIPKMNSTNDNQSKVVLSKLNKPIVSPQTSVVVTAGKNRGAPANTKSKKAKNDKSYKRKQSSEES